MSARRETSPLWLLVDGTGAVLSIGVFIVLDAVTEAVRLARLYVFRLRNAGTTNTERSR